MYVLLLGQGKKQELRANMGPDLPILKGLLLSCELRYVYEESLLWALHGLFLHPRGPFLSDLLQKVTGGH